jgi:hypothetical protein
MVPRGRRDGSLRSYSQVSRSEPLFFIPSSSSIALTRLSGLRWLIQFKDKFCPHLKFDNVLCKFWKGLNMSFKYFYVLLNKLKIFVLKFITFNESKATTATHVSLNVLWSKLLHWINTVTNFRHYSKCYVHLDLYIYHSHKNTPIYRTSKWKETRINKNGSFIL